jgi:hypothetical protein
MLQKVFFLVLLLISTKCLCLKPDSLYISTPDALGLEFESLKVKTPDSFNLQVWKIKADSTVRTNTTKILAYGDSGNMSYWLNQATIMTQKGFDMVLFDLFDVPKLKLFSLKFSVVSKND